MISGGLTSGWSLHRSLLHISSNLFLDIPVILPSFTAGMYLYSDGGDHNFALEVNSILVINIIIPRNLEPTLMKMTHGQAF